MVEPAAGTEQPKQEPEGQPPAGGEPGTSGSLIGKAAGDADANKQPGAGDGQTEFIGAPEKFEAYDIPEGVQMNEATTKELNDMAKSMNLSQVGVQQLVNLHVKSIQEQGDAAQAQFNQLKDEWAQETKTDLGAEFDKEMGMVRKTVQKFGTPELLQLMDDTGIGNHKAMVLFMRKVGKAIAEDVPVPGAGAAGNRSAADVLFGNKK